MSDRVVFTGEEETFRIENADRIAGLYLPSASERGLKSCFGPDLSGDAKIDQNHFLLEPVSIEDLRESRASRNFWLLADGGKLWSVTGRSSAQMAASGTDGQEDMSYEAGYMWQRIGRTWKRTGLDVSVTSFVPYDENIELHTVRICNRSSSPVTFRFAAAVPVYGRSADNIRDHRHVTSLLHVTKVTPRGVVVTPTLSFDERGHQKGDASYFVYGMDEKGGLPDMFFPVRDEYTGDNGTLENPEALRALAAMDAGAARAADIRAGAGADAGVGSRNGAARAADIRAGAGADAGVGSRNGAARAADIRAGVGADTGVTADTAASDGPTAVWQRSGPVAGSYAPGAVIHGQETMGAFAFAPVTLVPGASISYIVQAGIDLGDGQEERCVRRVTGLGDVANALYHTREYWKNKVNVSVRTGDLRFDAYMKYVAFQPELRRVFGCSFLPHHDYGRGGRGWRDLWQDCLALLLLDPSSVRSMLLGNFDGMRIDGTNATIIGDGPGEFKADRNSITRVWMDHAFWPLVTVKLYLDQSGDYDFLFEEAGYFQDAQVFRGTRRDENFIPSPERGNALQTSDGAAVRGTVLEHLLLENLAAFWEVGDHLNLRLRDADWNDALDLGGAKGESVAFTHAYAWNLLTLADLLEQEEICGKPIFLSPDLALLLPDIDGPDGDAAQKRAVLDRYLDAVTPVKTEKKILYDASVLSRCLRDMGEYLLEHLRRTEWISFEDGMGWFNGYYDNDGNALDGVGPAVSESADGTAGDASVRMMLPGQVFAIMGGIAAEEQVRAIIKAADRYLYDEDCGGYRLNTNYHEVKLNMGRMFGFAYGEKENGGVFSHMTVMYGNALYQRGFAAEGYKALDTLYRQAANFEVSRMLPGIPEYYGRNGRGLYSWLTGAGSWYLITVVTRMFGVRGDRGDLVIAPALMKDQFDSEGRAGISLRFADRDWNIRIENPDRLEAGTYKVVSAALDGAAAEPAADGTLRLSAEECIRALDPEKVHELTVVLGSAG